MNITIEHVSNIFIHICTGLNISDYWLRNWNTSIFGRQDEENLMQLNSSANVSAMCHSPSQLCRLVLVMRAGPRQTEDPWFSCISCPPHAPSGCFIISIYFGWALCLCLLTWSHSTHSGSKKPASELA